METVWGSLAPLCSTSPAFCHPTSFYRLLLLQRALDAVQLENELTRMFLNPDPGCHDCTMTDVHAGGPDGLEATLRHSTGATRREPPALQRLATCLRRIHGG